jgi:hypothetical protein
MAHIPTVSQLVQRLVVVACEVMLLNRAALQPFEIVFLDGFSSTSSASTCAASASSASASTFEAPHVFRFHSMIAQLQYENNLK